MREGKYSEIQNSVGGWVLSRQNLGSVVFVGQDYFGQPIICSTGFLFSCQPTDGRIPLTHEGLSEKVANSCGILKIPRITDSTSHHSSNSIGVVLKGGLCTQTCLRIPLELYLRVVCVLKRDALKTSSTL